MNVRLAAQILSESVSCALKYCVDANIDKLIRCGPTTKFIIKFNALFDILNSRNMNAKHFDNQLILKM